MNAKVDQALPCITPRLTSASIVYLFNVTSGPYLSQVAKACSLNRGGVGMVRERGVGKGMDRWSS